MHSKNKIRSVAASVGAMLMLGVVLAVVPAAGAGAQDAKPTLAVTAVDTNAGTVEITNHGEAEVDPNGIILCNFPAYAPIEGADMIPPGGSITVDSGAAGVALDPAGGEMGLYTSPAYEDPNAIITYVEWGEPGHQRAPVAVEAGIWADGVAEADGGVLTASTSQPTSPADWGAGAAAEEPAAEETSEEAAAEEPTELANTGTDAYWMAGIAGALVLLGFMLVGMGRRSRVL